MRTPKQDARFADATTAAILAEIQRHAAQAALSSVDAEIINHSADACPSAVVNWRAYMDCRDASELHKALVRSLRRTLASYIIHATDPGAALLESRAI